MPMSGLMDLRWIRGLSFILNILGMLRLQRVHLMVMGLLKVLQGRGFLPIT